MKEFFSYIKNNKILVLSLFIIFLIGLFLRTYRISDFMLWDDSARDVMVGQRIFNSGKFEFISPLAAGGGGRLFNSPLYYYVIALFWFITGSPEGVAYIFAFLGSLTIFVNFIIAREIKNDLAGLISAFLTSISFVLIDQSSSIFQPYLIPIMASSFFLCLVLSYKRLSYTFLSFAIFFFWLMFHIHYSILLFAPIFIFGMSVSLIRIMKKRFSWIKLSFISFLFFQLGIIWLIFSGSIRNLDFLDFLSYQTEQTQGGHLLTEYFNRVGSITKLFFSSLLGTENIYLIAGLMSTTISVLVYRLYHNYKTGKEYIWDLSFILLIFTFMFNGIFIGTFLPYYLIIFFIITPVLIGYLLLLIPQKIYIVTFLLLSIFSFHLNKSNYRMTMPFEGYSYPGAQKTTEIIINDIEKNNDLNFHNIFISTRHDNVPVYNWNSPRYWFFIEKYFGIKNMELTPGFNNLRSKTKSPKVFYLVCMLNEGYLFDEIIKICLDEYIDEYTSFLDSEYEILAKDFYGYQIFKLTVTDQKKAKRYWPFRFGVSKK